MSGVDELRRIGRELTYERNDPANRPVATLEAGEAVVVETQLASGPWLTGPDVRWAPGMTTANNPCVCLAVAGARPGDVLDVEILAIDPDDIGYMALESREAAVPALAQEIFGDYLSTTVRIEGGLIHVDDDVVVPARPMIGTLGTTLAGGSTTHLPGGAWGGNMDVQEVRAGAVVSLPVFVDGALLNVGDVHARQSDLEMSAVETRAEVTLRVAVRRSGRPLTGPRIVDATYLTTVGFDDSTALAMGQAVRSMHAWLVADHGLTAEQAYFLLGAAMEARCTRRLNGMNRAYVCKLERSLLPGPPA